MAGPSEFSFLDPGPLVDGDLSLVLTRRDPPAPAKGHVAGYLFEMRVGGANEGVGTVHFRAQSHPLLDLYRGHVGYNVDPGCRGRRYSERAVRLLFPFIRRHGFSTIWITCNPDNQPSMRTCERLGAALVDIVKLPATEEMYANGDRLKCRFRLDVCRST